MKTHLTWLPRVVRGVAISFYSVWLAAALPGFAWAQAANEPLPVDGIWSLSFYIDTRPGGETFASGPAIVEPYNLHVNATKESFSVNEDGSFSWKEPNCGRIMNDYHATSPGGATDGWGNSQVTLKVDGGLSVERTLKLNVQWTATDGLANVTGSASWFLTSYSMSPDGESRIQSYTGSHAVPPPTTVPVTYLTSFWTLQPESIEREEISPEVIRETVTYQGRNNSRYGSGSNSMPVVQRIMVKQIRHLKLVPRG